MLRSLLPLPDTGRGPGGEVHSRLAWGAAVLAAGLPALLLTATLGPAAPAQAAHHVVVAPAARHAHQIPSDAAGPVAQARAGAPAGDAVQIGIDNFAFTPRSLAVSAGTTVTWTNHDDVPHTVTASDRGFGSTALDTDDAFSYTFTTPGTYSYFCLVHPKMTAEIVVQ